MEIRSYLPQNNPPKELQNLIKFKYGKSIDYDLFWKDFKKSYRYCLNENFNFIPFGIYDGEELKGHLALIIDSRLNNGEAFFGFLEVENDPENFKKLWNHLEHIARQLNIYKLKGPINGSIWHQYRCIKESDGSEFFKSELFCESYYYDLLLSVMPKSEIEYYSGHRSSYDSIITLLKPVYDVLSSKFNIKQVDNVGPLELMEIANIARTVFRNSWGYTSLIDEEFLELYSKEKVDEHMDKMFLVTDEKGKIVGFCGTLKEDSETMIVKTICLFPEYQGLGLGNALAYKIHHEARQEGIKKIIYALIREDNQVKNFPKEGVTFFRRYSAFEFDL